MHGFQKMFHGWRQQNADIGDEHDAAENGVEAAEQFGSVTLQSQHWPHAAQNHAGIVQAVNPGKTIGEAIAQNADQQAKKQQNRCNQEVLLKMGN
jgi:VCBS repeat-containing protein